MRLILLLLLGFVLRGPLTGQEEAPRSSTLTRTQETIQLDGDPREASWAEAEVLTDFWIQQPIDGELAERRTEVRLLYDDKFLYVSAVCYDDDNYVVQTLKRDQFGDSDEFALFIDPVAEQTNGYGFGVNAYGAQTEVLITPNDADESWDNRWFSATQRYSDRWTVEIAIPFKTLRFEEDKIVWKINFMRTDPGTNQTHVWAPVPRQFDVADLGYYGDLVWPEIPGRTGGNVSLIPYVRAGTTRETTAGEPAVGSDLKAGGDAKIALSPTLNLDLTFNPDFSQVEVDRQVTNLSRFNIFFPERRQFFIENADLFNSFGQFANQPFYSRRIGLNARGQAVPIQYGVRLTGNTGPRTRVGLMNMHTAGALDNPAQNYTAAAFQRRIWKRSSLNGIFLNRQGFSEGRSREGDYGRNLGGEFNFSTADGKWRTQAAYLHSFKPDITDRNAHLYGRFDYSGQRFRTFLFLQHVGTNYFADMGFNNRVLNFDPVNNEVVRIGYSQVGNMIDYYTYPENSSTVNFHWSGLENFVWINAEGYGLNEWYTRLRHFIFFKNTSQLRFRLNNNYVDLIFPFGLTEEPLPIGTYNMTEFNVQFNTDVRRRITTEWFVVYGQFYNGTKLTYEGSLSYRSQPWGNFSLGIERNEIRLPEPYGNLNLTLATARAEINFSTNLFWTTFLQYNTQADNFNVNSRLQWRFAPMSDLYVVYTDNYRVAGLFGPKDRTLVMKLNYWLTL